MLDLFVRQQLNERDNITSATADEKRYRLVEPISLSDELDSWSFDQFRDIMNLWISLDDRSQTPFPKVWKFDPQGEIHYIIARNLFSNEENASKSQSERPRTKSLANFIHDVCRIEGNGKGNDWLGNLAEESITTYAHLSNLSQQEWGRIQKIPMNGLKTIKFYVDQAKQNVEERKVTKVPTTPSGSDGTSTSLKCLCISQTFSSDFSSRRTLLKIRDSR